MSARWIGDGNKPTTEVRNVDLAISKFISNKSEWNDSFITARRTLPLPPGKISKSFVTLF